MVDVPIHKAKTDLTKLIPLVEAGERVVITRHGRPVADLVPHRDAHDFRLARIADRRRARGANETVRLTDDFDTPLPDDVWFGDSDGQA